MATLQPFTASFVREGKYVQQVEARLSCISSVRAGEYVGDYRADYSPLSADELSATDPLLEQLLAHSKVVSSKRL